MRGASLPPIRSLLQHCSPTSIPLAFCILPVLITFILDHQSFLMGWNQGRGGLLFALVFLLFEYIGVQNRFTFRATWRRMLPLIAGFTLTQAYLTLTLIGLRESLFAWGEAVGLHLLYSWVWMWDYLILAAYLTAILTLSFGRRILQETPSPIIYLAGMSLILLLDALFPYETLGPLQSIVPIILYLDAQLLRMVGVEWVFTKGNVLTLRGHQGLFSLAVFWPSAGVHSMIIYSLIMSIFLVKMDLSRRRRVVYFSLGALGTFGVNIIRIFLLSAYAAFVTTNPAEFEEFHAIAGEVIFLPWLALYLLLILWIEGRRGGVAAPHNP